jgi:hypothetical protein
MNRYNTPFRFFDKKGKQFYPTFIYPIIEEKSSDIYIIGSYSDRLDNLAWTYYKDPTLWWIIAEANNIGMGNLLVPVGKQIRIPIDIQPIIQEYNILNSININN